MVPAAYVAALAVRTVTEVIAAVFAQREAIAQASLAALLYRLIRVLCLSVAE